VFAETDWQPAARSAVDCVWCGCERRQWQSRDASTQGSNEEKQHKQVVICVRLIPS